jgi:predicted RNA methylase
MLRGAQDLMQNLSVDGNTRKFYYVVPNPKLKQYEDFMLAESSALAELCMMESFWDDEGKKMVLSSADSSSARKFMARAVVCDLWEVLTNAYKSVPNLENYNGTGAIKIPGDICVQIMAFGGKRLSTKTRRRVLAQLGLKTTPNAPTQLGFFMDYNSSIKSDSGDVGVLLKCYLCRLISMPGTNVVAHPSLSTFKSRGSCPLTPELSHLLANIGKMMKGDICFDPFCGTCSIGSAVLSHGAFFIGADLFPESVGLNTNMEVVCGNIFQMSWHQNIFDQIICDPPFGTRCKQHTIESGNDQHFTKHYDRWNHDVFSKQAIEQRQILEPLFDLAATSLVNGGRLVFLFPNYPNNSSARWSPVDLPRRSNLKFITTCRQEWLKSSGHCVSRDCVVFEKF